MQRNKNLEEISLFDGFSKPEKTELMLCIDAEMIRCENEKIILHEGDRNTWIFIVLAGEAYGVKYDLSGREVIYTKMTRGSIFGDMLAVSVNNESPVTIRASAGTEILRFCFENLVAPEGESPALRVRLLKNLTSELAQKYFDLQVRMNCLLCPTLREKIIEYLQNEVRKQKGYTFNITLNREKLASYLNIDRSALSRALSSMKKDGILDFYKNSFKLNKSTFKNLEATQNDYQTTQK